MSDSQLGAKNNPRLEYLWTTKRTLKIEIFCLGLGSMVIQETKDALETSFDK